MVQMEHHHKRPVQGPVNGQNDRQGTAGRPVANLRPSIPTIPTLRYFLLKNNPLFRSCFFSQENVSFTMSLCLSVTLGWKDFYY